MNEERRRTLIELLDKALAMEYGTLWMLPRHMAEVEDEELRRQLKLIGDVELEHAEKSARMILSLGAEPKQDLPNVRIRHGVEEILEAHLEGERQAIAVYGRAIEATDDPKMRTDLERMRAEEEGHQRLIERALSRVRGG